MEFEALGIPFHHRGAIANEYLAVIKKCWTEYVVTCDGRWVSFREVYTGPRPLRSPHPPIWVGGSGGRLEMLSVMAERVVDLGSGRLL